MVLRFYDSGQPPAMDFAIITVAAVGAVFAVVMCVWLVRRRKYLSVKSRSFPLVLMSCMGNLLGMLVVSYDGYLRNTHSLHEWWILYVSLVAEYVFFVPYLLRVYHLKVTYFDYMTHEDRFWRLKKYISLKWFCIVFFGCLIPFLLLITLIFLLFLFIGKVHNSSQLL